MPARTLMIQGTTSDAGKRVLVAGLGRALRRCGVRAAPLKPQNRALNRAVTADSIEASLELAQIERIALREPV